jgi:hypothetical protein
MGIRQVPSGLNPQLDGFLRDLRQAVEGGIPSSVRTEIINAAANQAVISIGDGFPTPGVITTIINGVFDEIAKDPNWQHLADRIDVINGPESLPASMRGQLASTRATLQAALDQQGSSITTLETITSTQATQITTLQTNVSGNSSAIVILNQTTATQATQINALGTRMGSAESSIVTLNSTTATTAAQVSTLNTTVNGQSASIQTLSQTTSDINNRMSAQWTVKTDVNGRVAGIGLFNDGITSSFYVRVDRFAVGDDSTGARPCFAVQNGNVYIQQALIGTGYIDNARIADAAISAAKIQYAAIDTLRVGGNAVTTLARADAGGQYTSLNLWLPNGAQNIVVFGQAGVGNNSATQVAGVNIQLKVNGNEIANGGTTLAPGFGCGPINIGAPGGGVGAGWCGVEIYAYHSGGSSNITFYGVTLVAFALMR